MVSKTATITQTSKYIQLDSLKTSPSQLSNLQYGSKLERHLKLLLAHKTNYLICWNNSVCLPLGLEIFIKMASS
jgi:hypothetical protein